MVTERKQVVTPDGQPHILFETDTPGHYVQIPIIAIPDRRSVYGIAACERSDAPGAFCTAEPLCSTCEEAVQKCLDEHRAAGRL